jgi:hypothetical protein
VRADQEKYPKAVQCLTKDRETLLAFYDIPAEHRVHIRSTNVIEFGLPKIRHRTDRAKSYLTRAGMLAMMFMHGMAVEPSWKRLREFDWLAKIIRGVKFRDGVEVQEPRHHSRRREYSRDPA